MCFGIIEGIIGGIIGGIVGGVTGGTTITAGAIAGTAVATSVLAPVGGGLGALGLAAGIAGGVVSTVSGIQGMEAQKRANNYNSQVAQQQAEIANTQAEELEAKGVEEKRKHLAKVRSMIGTQKAMFGASGQTIGEGSSYDLLEETANSGTQDALSLQHDYDQKAYQAKTQASMYSSKSSMYEDQNDSLTSAQWTTGIAGGLSIAGNGASSAYKLLQVNA